MTIPETSSTQMSEQGKGGINNTKTSFDLARLVSKVDLLAYLWQESQPRPEPRRWRARVSAAEIKVRGFGRGFGPRIRSSGYWKRS